MDCVILTLLGAEWGVWGSVRIQTDNLGRVQKGWGTEKPGI